ncbi:MAG: phosphate ABC transporter permease PstA [Acidobacteria bacterium]|nr:phosphate ABC transporter permease PstA [Acidobacteriota bacterium]MBI3278618.1 phosphate ABC transporter permease PstA [Acidobacteriota bacterium]
MYRFRWRKIVNLLMFGITGLCTLVTVAVLFLILGYLVWKGGTSINLDFFTQLPKPPGEAGGGMANAILGSAQLVLVAALIGVPVGFVGGVYLAEFGGPTWSFVIRYVADLLNGVPSIVLGIFAYSMVVLPMRNFSVLAGGFALSIIFIPLAVRTTEQFLRAVEQPLREGALALGASKWKAIATVVIPAAMRGVATGMMLGIARVAGETAPLLFTSFNNRYWSSGIDEPAASLPVMIFTYAISPYPDWHRQAWAAGLVLLALILVVNVIARVLLLPKHAHGH